MTAIVLLSCVKSKRDYAEGMSGVGSFKKSDLIACLIRHFQTAQSAADPTPAQKKAQEWLPEPMLLLEVGGCGPGKGALLPRGGLGGLVSRGANQDDCGLWI